MAYFRNTTTMTNCHVNPSEYKLCSPYTCVTRETPCPCGPFEYTCLNLSCIPDSRLCDDNDDCSDGSDEHMCNKGQITQEMLSTPVMAGIIAGCLLLIVVLIVGAVLYLKWKNRKRKTTGRKLDNKGQREKHENRALVTSTSMEDSNEHQPPRQKNLEQFYTPIKSEKNSEKFHTPTKERRIHTDIRDHYHIPADFEEGLLCTSTPKQPLRQLLMTIKSIDDV